MSLIHEALKKAEAQRRLGEPPTLGTPFGQSRARRSLLPIMSGLIAVALGAGWWLSSRQSVDDAPAAAAESKSAAAPRESAPESAAKQPRASGTAASTAAERHPVGSPESATAKTVGSLVPVPGPINQAPPPGAETLKEVAERESEPHPAGTNPLAPGEAAPLALAKAPSETPASDPAGQAAKDAAKAGKTTTLPTPPPPPNASAATAAAPPMNNAATKTGTTPAPAPPPANPIAPPTSVANAPPAPAPAPGTAPPPVAAPAESLPLYWQLPLNVRKELPALKLSMHVYSPTPAQRFVVLNGNRQVEGDDLGADVRLAEIRIDGAVLEFHGQRFLVPRGGS